MDEHSKKFYRIPHRLLLDKRQGERYNETNLTFKGSREACKERQKKDQRTESS